MAAELYEATERALAAEVKRREEAERNAGTGRFSDGQRLGLVCDALLRGSQIEEENKSLKADNARLRASLGELLTCHAEGGFVEPDKEVLDKARAALNHEPKD